MPESTMKDLDPGFVTSAVNEPRIKEVNGRARAQPPIDRLFGIAAGLAEATPEEARLIKDTPALGLYIQKLKKALASAERRCLPEAN
jgi:hypothetical protein